MMIAKPAPPTTTPPPLTTPINKPHMYDEYDILPADYPKTTPIPPPPHCRKDNEVSKILILINVNILTIGMGTQ